MGVTDKQTAENNCTSCGRLILQSEKGIALMMVLVLSAVVLATIAGLVYVITSGTQISGIQKRYRTALEAGIGGAGIASEIIGLRGEKSSLDALTKSLSSIDLSITTADSCTALSSATFCSAFGSYTGIATKLHVPTACWSGCDYSRIIDPTSSATYDISFRLHGTPSPYNVYAKVVDTVPGNTGGDEDLIKSGVVSAHSGEVVVMTIPYLYAIEVNAENSANPSEKARLSILYQY